MPNNIIQTYRVNIMKFELLQQCYKWAVSQSLKLTGKLAITGHKTIAFPLWCYLCLYGTVCRSVDNTWQLADCCHNNRGWKVNDFICDTPANPFSFRLYIPLKNQLCLLVFCLFWVFYKVWTSFVKHTIPTSLLATALSFPPQMWPCFPKWVTLVLIPNMNQVTFEIIIT